MVTALIRIAQVVNLDVFGNPDTIRAGRELYTSGALKLVNPEVPVRINHEKPRVVGRVLGLIEHDDTDGRWCFARCQIDQPPEWLRRGTAASMSWANTGLVREMPGGWTQFTHGRVTEVSILSPAVRPFETGAKVVLLESSPAAPAGKNVIHHPPNAAILRRPGIGQVLGVR